VTTEQTPFVLGGPLRRDRSVSLYRSLLPAAAVAVLVALPLRGLFLATGSSMEEGFMLVFPERLLRGDLPNLDFLHLYGPFSLHVLAGWYALLGTTLHVERWFGLLQHLAVIAGAMCLARVWGRAVALVVGTLVTLLLLTPIGLAALAWEGGVALSTWALIAAVRAHHVDAPSRVRWAMASGVLTGAALGFRPDLVLALGLSVVVTVGVVLLRHVADRRRLRGWFIGGLGIGLLPVVVHVVLAGPAAVWRGMVIEPVVHLRPGRELPRPPTLGEFDGALQGMSEGPLDAPWWGLPSLGASAQIWLWFWVVIAVAVVVPLVAWRRFPHPVLLAGSMLGLGMLPQALQRPDSTHLAWGSALSFAMLPCLVAEWRRHRTPAPRASSTMMWCAAPVLVLLLVVAPYFTLRPWVFHSRVAVGQKQGGHVVTRDDRRFTFGNDALRRASQPAIDALADLSSPGERLFVGPADLRRTIYNDVAFYHLFPELEPATYFIEMDPGLADREGSRLSADIASADWVLLTNFWTGWYEPNASIEFGSDEPNRVVADQFCLVGSYEDALVLLYRKCATGDGVDPSTIGIGVERRADFERELARRGPDG
jgi:hypothetical protein